MTQEGLAAESGVSAAQISRIVNGLHPTDANRDAIAAALGRTVTELWPDNSASAAA